MHRQTLYPFPSSAFLFRLTRWRVPHRVRQLARSRFLVEEESPTSLRKRASWVSNPLKSVLLLLQLLYHRATLLRQEVWRGGMREWDESSLFHLRIKVNNSQLREIIRYSLNNGNMLAKKLLIAYEAYPFLLFYFLIALSRKNGFSKKRICRTILFRNFL